MAFDASEFFVAAPSEKCGSSSLSPRSGNGICRSLVIQLSGSVLLIPGKVPSANPGTATTSHSAPLDICTVSICTTSLRTSGAADFNPPSSSAVISSHCRNAPSDPPLRANFPASSIKRSRCLRPEPVPSRSKTSVSKFKYRSISLMRSVIVPPARERNLRRSAAKFSNRSKPSLENVERLAFAISSRESIKEPRN